jgi:hypothetical protein
MRNRFGIEIKKGFYVYAHHPRGGTIEGRVEKIERGAGGRITLDSGYSIAPDDVTQTLGPMTVGRGGVVKQNPARGETWLVHPVGKPESWYAQRGSKAAASRLANQINRGNGFFAEKGLQTGPEYTFSRASWSDAGGDGGVKQNPVTESRELFLFALNEQPIYKLSREAFKGERDWNSVALNAARLYGKEHGNGSASWTQIFTKADLAVVASMLREHYAGGAGFASNPLVRVKVKSPPQRPAGNDDAPSKRLVKRRKTTARAPRGVWANPVDGPFTVLVLKPGKKTYQVFAKFTTKTAACKYAVELNKDNPTWAVMVSDDDHS